MLINFYRGGNILLEVELKRNSFIIQNKRINQYLYFTHKYWLDNNLFQERVVFFVFFLFFFFKWKMDVWKLLLEEEARKDLCNEWITVRIHQILALHHWCCFVMNGSLSGSIKFLLFITDAVDVAFFLAIWHSCWRRRRPDEWRAETKNSHRQGPCSKPEDPAFQAIYEFVCMYAYEYVSLQRKILEMYIT